MNKLKIILLGTGGGYGESVVAQIGEDEWMIVDSCIDPNTNEPLPLSFLKTQGINVEQQVKLVVCTHWHSDHITGLDAVLRCCTHASFCLAFPFEKNKFLGFIGFDCREVKKEASSTKVLARCLNELNEKGREEITAVQDRVIYTNTDGVEVHCLSPSDKTIKESAKELSQLMKLAQDSNVKIPYLSPNDKCVVLQIKSGQDAVLLGSDLNKKGWEEMLDHSSLIRNSRFSLIKIPHHGSETGYSEKLWEVHIPNSATGLIAPYNKSGGIPQKEMLKVYYDKTDALYITSSLAFPKNKQIERESSQRKMIKAMNPTIHAIPYSYGAITSELNSYEGISKWDINLSGTAHKVEYKFFTD